MNMRSADGLNTTLGTMRLGPLTVVSESDTLQVVASSFRRDAVSSAVLVESPLRVVTEHDLSGAWVDGHNAEDEVAQVATAHPYWAPVSASVAEAAALMVSLGIRHLLVLDLSGQPTGIISMGELFAVLVRAQEPMSFYESFAAFVVRNDADRDKS
jgi:signal-transduction protein with cAMP-binding, CBS, and nucleotidyltransferase domain